MANSTSGTGRWGQPMGQPEASSIFGESQRKFKTGRYPGTLPPEVHFQVSKKIAQLTKVIYTLNARLDEQESVMEALKTAYEERLQQLLIESKQKITQYKAKANSATELQQKLGELETLLANEKKTKEELETALRTAEEKKANSCKTCGHLPNGVFLKSLKKEFDCVKSARKKEEELEIIDRILRKKSSKIDPLNPPNSTNPPNNPPNNSTIPTTPPTNHTNANSTNSTTPNDPLTARVKHTVVVDIPEKDTQQTHRLPESTGSGSHATSGSRFVPDSTTLPSAPEPNCRPPLYQERRCSASSASSATEKTPNDHREKELQSRLSESQKDMLRLQVENKKMERAMARKEEELNNLRQKVECHRESVGIQTEYAEEQIERERNDVVNSAQRIERELKETLSGLQAVSSALKLTGEEVDTRQRDLSTSLFPPASRRCSVQSIENQTQTDELATEDDPLSSSLGFHGNHTQGSNEKTKEELKEKMSELLEQVTLLMTSGDLCSGNMSDAEKECAELKRVLREKEEKFKRAMAAKDKEYQDKMAAALQLKEAAVLTRESELVQEHTVVLEALTAKHITEMELAVQETERRLRRQNETLQKDHDGQLQNFQDEVGEMSRRLQSQTELQTAEMTRLNHELDEALMALEKKDEDTILRELNLTKALEEERSKVRSGLEAMQQSQKQQDLLSKQLDQKRDELLQVRREATQQIRNLENYWLEKVNQELTRIRRAFTDEKKNMIENFCKSQRLLKDKIAALQIQSPCDVISKPEIVLVPGSPITRKELNKIRRDSVKSEIDSINFQHEEDEDLISISSETIEEEDEEERICASQPNVAYQSPAPPSGKKERVLSEQRFIKRAESVLLPKLQFLSFWKSASNLEKCKKQQRSASCSSSVFPRQESSTTNLGEAGAIGGVTVAPNNNNKIGTSEMERQFRKKFKMSPSHFYHRSNNPVQNGGQIHSANYVQTAPGLQQARSSSCFNLSCKIGGGPVFGSGDVFNSVLSSNKNGKRNSLGSTRWLGVVPETREDHSSNPGSDTEGKTHKEPLLESEL